MQPDTQFITREDFHKKYWFTPMHIVTVINPRDEDYNFKCEGRQFSIGKGQHKPFPGTVANVFLSQMTRIIAQEEEKFGHLSDLNLMAAYYDRLIVDIQDQANQNDLTPSYLKDVKKPQTEAEETPPWEENVEKATEVKPPEPEPDVDEPKQAKKPVDKEFELKGDKYKLKVTKDDRLMYFKNGKMTSEAEYAKAASML